MKQKIEELTNKLNKASESYYNGDEIMTNAQWDAMFDELRMLEEETGYSLPDSPTKSVGSLPKIGTKIPHEYPAKSLDKTKDIDQIREKMASAQEVLLMWKLDGGTLQLTYEKGRLITAATRGNGQIGQDITRNAAFIQDIPMTIPFEGKLILRGEALMSYEDFDAINETLPEDEQYANPRNLANATVSMLDPNEVKKRSVALRIFGMVFCDTREIPLFHERMEWIESLGFKTVEWERVKPEHLSVAIESWTERVSTYKYPVDGLVISSNDIGEAEKLPGTAHHPDPLAGYAFKWADTEKETILNEIEWSPSRTGLINPVAIFNPVELEGTIVSRASLHNFSYIRDKHLRIGDKITVYKANMIIPQVRDNLSENTSPLSSDECEGMLPLCPACGHKSVFHVVNGVETIHCENPGCGAKRIGGFVHFCSRSAMDIEGLSEATLTKFVNNGFLHNLGDIYRLNNHADEIKNMEGFGEKSWENLWRAIEKSKSVDITSFLTAIGIPNIGRGQAGLIVKHFGGDAKAVLEAVFDKGEDEFDFTIIDGFGGILNDSLHGFAKTVKEEKSILGDLISQLDIQDVEMAVAADSAVAGKVFVITGSVNNYPNRDALKAEIESLGGKVTGSVTSKTNYLINNDVTSTSGKNKKALELGVPIISEEEYIKMKG